jgi:hypothetical protein
VGYRLAGCEKPRGLSELLGFDLAIDPTVEDLDHGPTRLQTLGPHRPDGIGSYLCTAIHDRLPQDIALIPERLNGPPVALMTAAA